MTHFLAPTLFLPLLPFNTFLTKHYLFTWLKALTKCL